jgi:hypothetical protein
MLLPPIVVFGAGVQQATEEREKVHAARPVISSSHLLNKQASQQFSVRGPFFCVLLLSVIDSGGALHRCWLLWVLEVTPFLRKGPVRK